MRRSRFIATWDRDFLSQFTKRPSLSSLRSAASAFVRQKPVTLFYKDHQIGEHRLDFLVEDLIVVELKAIRALEDIHFAIGRSYLKATGLQDGLLLNFATLSPND